MTREGIKRNILQKIDEISPFANTDEQYDLLIEGMLDDMANRFAKVIPFKMINGRAIISQTHYSHGTGQFQDLGIVELPNIFLRFISATCPHWRRTVSEKDLLDTENYQYNRQFDIHTRAGVAKPKVFIDNVSKIPTAGIRQHLIVSPFRQNWLLSSLQVQILCRIKAEELDIYLLDGFFYYAASAVLTSMRQEGFSKVMMERFEEWMRISG